MVYEIEIIADYHTHTRMAGRLLGNIPGKHAKGSIKENAIVAIRRGLKEIAITDHGYKNVLYGIKKKKYAEIRKIIDELNEYYKNKGIDFRILLGVEANAINPKGDIDVDDGIIEYLDLISAGYHAGTIQLKNLSVHIRDRYHCAFLHYMIRLGVG